jgi:hypothetical protein
MKEKDNNYGSYEAAISDLISLVENLPSLQSSSISASTIVQNIWNLELLYRSNDEDDFLIYTNFHMELCIEYGMNLDELNSTILYKVSKYANLKKFVVNVNLDMNDSGEMNLGFQLLDHEEFIISLGDIKFRFDDDLEDDENFAEPAVKRAILFTRNKAYFSFVKLHFGFTKADFKKSYDPFILLIPYYFSIENVDQYIKFRFIKIIQSAVESDHETVLGFTEAFDQLSFAGFKKLFSYQYNMDILEMDDENDETYDNDLPF